SERHQLAAACCTDPGAFADLIDARPILRAERRHGLAATQGLRLGFRQGERRDVVQRRLERKQVPGSGRTMPQGLELRQGNRPLEGEATDGNALQFSDIGKGAEVPAEVAGERPY